MSTKKNRTLYYLDELSDYKIASDYNNIKGWEVRDADNRVVGKVDRLLVNKEAERVVYVEVEVDQTIIEEGHDPYASQNAAGIQEFINKNGDNHLIIPIGMVTLDKEHKIVRSMEINYHTFAKTQRYKRGADIQPTYEASVYRSYSGDSNFKDDTIYDDDFYSRREFDANRDRNTGL